MPGNKRGFTKENARQMQRLSVESRLRNQKKRMRRALLLASAEMNEWEAVEKMFLQIAQDAMDGDVDSALFVIQMLGL